MAIKRFNQTAAYIQRPLRLADIQDIWDGINNILTGGDSSFTIISGLEYLDSYGTLSAGVAAYRGQLYYYDGGGNIKEGQTIYYGRVNGESRTFANGYSYVFDFSYIISPTAQATEGGILVSASNNNAMWLNNHRWGKVADGAITTEKIADGAVTAAKLTGALAPAYLASVVTRTFDNTLFSIPLSDFITPDAMLNVQRQTRYVKITTTASITSGFSISINGGAVRNQALYPEELTLIVNPPETGTVSLFVNGAATDSANPVSVSYSTSFEPVPNIEASGFKPRLIVCVLKKITKSDYICVNAYQTTTFSLPREVGEIKVLDV